MLERSLLKLKNTVLSVTRILNFTFQASVQAANPYSNIIRIPKPVTRKPGTSLPVIHSIHKTRLS